MQRGHRGPLLGLRLAGGAVVVAAAAMALPAAGQAASVQNIHPPSGAALIEGPVTLRWDLDVSDCDPGKTAVTQVQVEVDGQPGPAYLPEPASSGLNAGLFAAAAGDGFRSTLNAVNVRTDGAPSVYRWRAFVDCTGPGIPPDPTAVPIQAVGPWSEFRVTRVGAAPGTSGGTAPKPKPKPRRPREQITRHRLVFMTFIPANYLEAPHPEATCLGAGGVQGLIGHGDDRGFDRTAADRPPTEPRSYRSLQEVTIERRSRNGKLHSLRVVPGTLRHQIGVSDSYVARGPGGALDHGRLGLIDALDDDGATGDCQLLHGRNPGTAGGLPAPQVRRTGAATRRVHLGGAVRNGLIVLSPKINWAIDVDLDFSGSRPKARVSGRHDNFPGYEMYLGERAIYQWAPASIRKKRLPVTRVGGAIAGLFADHPIPTAKPPRGGGGFGGGSSGGGGAGR